MPKTDLFRPNKLCMCFLEGTLVQQKLLMGQAELGEFLSSWVLMLRIDMNSNKFPQMLSNATRNLCGSWVWFICVEKACPTIISDNSFQY